MSNLLNFRAISNIRCCGHSSNTLPRYLVSVEIEFQTGWERVEYAADSTDCEQMGLAIWSAVNDMLGEGASCVSYDDFQRTEQAAAVEGHDARMEMARSDAYTRETDPLLGQVQRGDVSQADYVAACNAVKARFPYLAEMTLEQKQAMYPLVTFIE